MHVVNSRETTSNSTALFFMNNIETTSNSYHSVFYALVTVRRMRFDNAQFETDYAILHQNLLEWVLNCCWNISVNIKILSLEFTSYTFSRVPRFLNKAVDLIAKRVLTVLYHKDGTLLGGSLPPGWDPFNHLALANILLSDLSHFE